MQRTSCLRMPLAQVSIVLLAVISCTRPAAGYKPEDPEVVAMVEKAIKYLELLPESEIRASTYGGNDGQVFLVAYTHFKYSHDENANVVKLGLKTATDFISKIKKQPKEFESEHKSNYELAMAMLMLAEVAPSERADDLAFLAATLLASQKNTGSFGYPDYKTGDISMVQYVALATWTLDHAGVNVSLDRINQLLAWTMRVQDVSGLWPYQGEDPGPGRGLIPQPKAEMSLQMGLAGGSAVLILSDVFKIWDNAVGGATIEGLPKALKKVDKTDIVEQRRKRSPVKQPDVLAALRRMDSFRERTPFVRNKSKDWYYYYLYTLERYESFFELALGKSNSNAWYDENVAELMKVQDSSGGFGVRDSSLVGSQVSTCFAVLFLIRSTQKAIASVSKGSMRGGYGIPKNTAEIRVEGTQIVGKPVAESVDNLLGLLEGDDADNIEGKSIPENLKLESDPAKRVTQLDRLMRLLRGSESWQARRVAARVLGTSDELSVVPTLIYALSDGDKSVQTYALDGLNYISRKFESEIKIKEANPAEIRKMQQEWTKWYRTIDPAFIDTTEF